MGAAKTIGGGLSTAGGTLNTLANRYPLPAMMLAQGVASAVTPTEAEVLAEQEKDRLRRLAKNTNVGSLNTNIIPNPSIMQKQMGVR